MSFSSSKENILKKIRKALTQTAPLPFPGSEGNTSVFTPSTQDLEVEFAEEFTRLMGKFVFCFDNVELEQQLQNLVIQQKWAKIFCAEPDIRQHLSPALQTLLTEDIATCDVSFTSCECLVARTGTIVLSSATEAGRTGSIYAPIHLCIATTSQLVYDVKDGLQLMKEKYPAGLPSMLSFASGPSRTADIEKTLVVGVHGPKEVYVFLVEEM